MCVKKLFYVASSCIALLLSGCVDHNVPSIGVEANDPIRMTAFVDQDGTFYPDELNQEFPARRNYSLSRGAHSLRLMAMQRNDGGRLLTRLEQEETIELKDFKKVYKSKSRIFILVHGFNNLEHEANWAYERLEDRIAFKKSDGIIRFHWDGLSGKMLGAASIWNNATGYSALGGQRGLRRLLNQFSKKEIILISHSRGASVVLSALSNPKYFGEFEKESMPRFASLKTLSEIPPLKNNGNRIKLVMLAPAIGEPDFYAPGGDLHRDLGPQLVSLSYTINQRDKKLKKYVSFMTDKFSDTGLGYRSHSEKKLSLHYKNINVKSYTLDDVDGHGFGLYIASIHLPEILKDIGIETN